MADLSQRTSNLLLLDEIYIEVVTVRSPKSTKAASALMQDGSLATEILSVFKIGFWAFLVPSTYS